MPRYIDADALNAAIEEWFNGVCVYDVSPLEAVNDFQSIVDEQPTISPDEVRGVGKWINKTMSVPNGHGQTYNRWGCSVCKAKFKSRANYCPNCGARLTGGEND